MAYYSIYKVKQRCAWAFQTVGMLVFVLFLEGLLQPHTKMARAQCVTAYRKNLIDINSQI